MDNKVTWGSISSGIILLIIGLSMALYVQPLIDDYETDIGYWQRQYSPEKQREYENYVLIRTTGIIFIVVGIIGIAIGLYGSAKRYPQQPQYPQQQQDQQPYQQPQYPQQQYQQPTPQPLPQPTPQPTQQQIRICKNCYAKLDVNWISCPYCGQSTP